MTILERIYQNSKNNPKKIALIDGDTEINYSDLWKKILSANYYFSKLADRGTRIALIANKSIDFVFCYFGAQLAGLITVILDPSSNFDRIKFIINKSKPVMILGILDNSYSEFEVKEFPKLNENVNEIDYMFPNEHDFADVLFTTGTTGDPKGVVLSHYNEYWTADSINSFLKNDSSDIELLALPLSHSFGLGRLRCVLSSCGTVVLLKNFANVKKYFNEIEKRRITGLSFVPTSWNYIKKISKDKIKKYASQLKYIEIGSAPMNIDDKKFLAQLLPNTRICMHYGLTEASRSTFLCFNEEICHLDSLGHPSPHVSIKIFDSFGNIVTDEGEGEICVKGPNVCCSFLLNTKDNYSDSFFGEYFRTGDYGYIDRDGYVYYVGRNKELINVGGKKVSPIEIESVINSIDEVIESACIGIHDDVMGQVVKAFIVVKKNIKASDIIQYVKHRLEPYKVPNVVEFTEKIPKTASGKIQRLFLK